MSAASDEGFRTLDIARFNEVIAKIHETVGGRCGRLELTRDGCDDVCVVISKCELEALERALEILTECAEYKSMCDEVSKVAAATSVVTPPYTPVA